MVRQKLLKPTPDTLDACGPHLRNAIESIGWLQSRLETGTSTPASSRGTLQWEMDELRCELSQATALMRNAASFYGGLARLLSPADDGAAGYASNGTVLLRAAPTLQLEG